MTHLSQNGKVILIYSSRGAISGWCLNTVCSVAFYFQLDDHGLSINETAASDHHFEIARLRQLPLKDIASDQILELSFQGQHVISQVCTLLLLTLLIHYSNRQLDFYCK